MQTRLRLLKGATALLYFGPLLAGLGGFGWSVVPLFLAIFMLWLFILRPQQWPRSAADWARPEALIALLTQGVVQLLLVAISFGIGRGIGGVLGALPPFPLMLPVAVSFLSIPLARMLWDPWQADGETGLLDEALARMEQSPPPVEDLRARVEVAERMVQALQNLPEDTGVAVLADHLAAMGTQVSAEALRVALMDPIYDKTATAVHWRAAVVHATDGKIADALAGTGYAQALFHQLAEPSLLRLFAERCCVMLGENPARAADCPDADHVRAQAARNAKVSADLNGLAAALEAARARG